MKLVLLFLKVCLLLCVITSKAMDSDHISDTFQQTKAQKERLITMLMRLEKKKHISTTTCNNILHGDTKNMSTILSEIDPHDLDTFNQLDLKERKGSILNLQESECLKITIENIIKTSMLSLCENIYKKTKLKYLNKQEKKISQFKKNIQNLIKVLAENSFITKFTYESLLQEEYFEPLLKIVMQEQANIQALTACTEMLPLLLSGNELNRQQSNLLNASIARILYLTPIKKFESIDQTIQWLKNNKKISLDEYKFFDTLEQFLLFCKTISYEQIDLFLTYHQLIITSHNQVTLSHNLTKEICLLIHTFIAKQKKLKYSELRLTQLRKPLNNEELERELEEILQISTSETGTISRNLTPSPEMDPEPYIRKSSDPQSPAIPIKNPFIKTSIEEKKS